MQASLPDLHEDPVFRFRRVALATIVGAPLVFNLTLTFPVILTNPSLVVKIVILVCAFGWTVGAVTGLLFWAPLRAVWVRMVRFGRVRGWSMRAEIVASLATSVLAACCSVLVLLVVTIITNGSLSEFPPLGDAIGFAMTIVPPVAFTAAIAGAILYRPGTGARA